MTVSTHVLDTQIGRPAAAVPIRLDRYEHDERLGQETWRFLAEGETDAGGRWSAPEGDFGPGLYRLRFRSGDYFAALGAETFYPEISVIFTVAEAVAHHVPLLLSPFGYSTYRGS